MSHGKFVVIALLVVILTGAAPWAAEPTPESPGINFVVDAVDQFNALSRRGDGLAFGVGDLPETLDFSTCKHFQGMARMQGPGGVPYFFVTRSGNDPGAFCVTGDDPGNLFVVRMGSRDRHGERLRTNRLQRDWVPYVRNADGDPIILPNGELVTWTKPPDPRDRTETLYSFDGGNPYYGHPGGMQLVGDVLAIGLEVPYADDPDTVVAFYDVSNPTNPTLLTIFDVPGLAGVVGLTPVRNPFGPGLRFLMVTTGGDNDVVRFHRSLSTVTGDINGPTDLKSPDLAWEPLRTVTESQLEADSCFGGTDWPTGGPIRSAFGHQMLNFLRQGSIDGPLFLIGGRNDGIAGEGSDYLDLYRVHLDADGVPLACPLTPVGSRHMSSFPYNGHGDSAALSAAPGAYVSPSGELIVYATEYTNKGPFELRVPGSIPVPGYPTVRFVEWRHANIVRGDSPTLRPTAVIDGSDNAMTVDEGGSVPVLGHGEAAITKAWVALYEDDGAGSSLPGILDDDLWLQVDYADRDADHFDELDRFDDTTGTDIDENAGSWRWFAHSGCTMSANDYPRRSDEFPGPDTVRLIGLGNVERVNELDHLQVFTPDSGSRFSPVPEGLPGVETDYDDDVAGITFYHRDGEGTLRHDCEQYYDAPIGFAWDLDGDGSFETDAKVAVFSAAGLDGPSSVPLAARAQHPSDPTALGTGFTTRPVVVRNVPPSLGRFALLDSLGLSIGGEVPFAIAGTPITAVANFTDPGHPDRQTAILSWGDGIAEPNGQFDQFNDAFGGVTGALEHEHLYAQAGTYTVGLEVTDDDLGVARASLSVRMLTPLEAVGSIIALLDEEIAAATSDAQRTALRNARKALAGSVEGLGSNGALDKLEDDLLTAAIIKLELAIGELLAAQAAGSDVAGLIALLRQVVAVLEAAL